MEANKSYDKYYVERDPATGYPLIKADKTPELGKCAKKDCRLEPRHVKNLNRGWENSGVYFVEVKAKKEIIEKSEARLALEKEAVELGIKFNPKIGDDKLEIKINEKKEN